jgi:hypothetical protein
MSIRVRVRLKVVLDITKVIVKGSISALGIGVFLSSCMLCYVYVVALRCADPPSREFCQMSERFIFSE